MTVTCDGCQRVLCPDHHRPVCECMGRPSLGVCWFRPDAESGDVAGDALQFCGWSCLGTYATSRALVESAGEAEP